jgi:hypothetical protein
MTSPPHRFIRAVLVSACLAVGLVGVQPASAAAKTYGCPDVPVKSTPEGLYGGYFTNLSAKGYSSKARACRSARSLVRAYYNCRRKKGVRGSCSGRTINGLRCRESNRRTSPAYLTATVTCTKGAKRIKHTYQQGLQRP